MYVKNLLKVKVIIDLLDMTMFQEMINDYCGEIKFRYLEITNNENVLFLLDEGKKVFVVCSVFAGGFFIAIIFYAYFIHRENNLVFDEDNTFYETKYLEEYKNLELNELSDDYDGDYLEEETPRGTVFLNYDKELNLFNDYSDSKEIPFFFLESVSRKFVIKYDSKKIHVDYYKEYKKAEEKFNILLKEEKEEKEEKEKQQIIEEEKAKKEREENVFATFKSYNKDTGSISKNVKIEQEKHVIVPEVCNVYKYRGKLWQFHEERNNESKKKDTDSTINLSYKDFIKKNKNN